MKNVVNKILNNAEIDEVVVTEDTINFIDEEGVKLKKIDDIRSAIFYCMGRALKSKVCFVLPNAYMSQIYTGIVEGWFQNKNILILSIYDGNKKMDVSNYAHYISGEIDVKVETFNDSEIDCFLKGKGQRIINIKKEGFCLNQHVNNYSKEIEIIKEFFGGKIIGYNCKNNEIDNIEYKYRYGIISKYLGKICANNEKSLLLCDFKCLLNELNVFNSRYIDENFKILAIDKENEFNDSGIEKWLNNNRIVTLVSDNIEKSRAKEFVSCDKPCVYILTREVK